MYIYMHRYLKVLFMHMNVHLHILYIPKVRTYMSIWQLYVHIYYIYIHTHTLFYDDSLSPNNWIYYIEFLFLFPNDMGFWLVLFMACISSPLFSNLVVSCTSKYIAECKYLSTILIDFIHTFQFCIILTWQPEKKPFRKVCSYILSL